MNVFILDLDMEKSAQMLDDAHLKAQINEACQILTANWNSERCEEYAVIGHLHHPVTKYYAGSNTTSELLSYLYALTKEYYFRFGKEHQNYFWAVGFETENPKFKGIYGEFYASKTYVKGRMTRDIDAIRRYISTKPHTKPLTWTRREKPGWWGMYGAEAQQATSSSEPRIELMPEDEYKKAVHCHEGRVTDCEKCPLYGVIDCSYILAEQTRIRLEKMGSSAVGGDIE